MKDCLHYAPWQAVDIYDDVNDIWKFFRSVLFEYLDSFASWGLSLNIHIILMTLELLSLIKKETKAK